MSAGDQQPIVIAFDASGPAQVAIAEAGRLFAGRQTIVLTAWDPALTSMTLLPTPGGAGIAATPLDIGALESLDRAASDHAGTIAEQGAELARQAGLKATPLVETVESSAWATIVHVAHERNAAAVVMGSRGRSGLRSALLGSTSQAVLHHCSRPVMIVREHDDEQ